MKIGNQHSCLRVFFAPDGATGGDGTGGDQQQQQQQQQPVDPFKGIDIEMLDEDTAKAVKEAQSAFQSTQQNLQSLQNRYGQLEHFARTKQSELDKAKAAQQQQSQQRPGEQEQSFDEVLKQLYIEEGLTEAQAAAAAKLQSKVLLKHTELLDKKFGSVVGAVGKTAASTKAELAFRSVQQQNNYLGDAELAQEVWEGVETLLENGHEVTPELISNIADLKAMKRLKDGKLKMDQVQVNQQPPQNQQQQQPFGFRQASRFSFPGAGHSPVAPSPTSSARNLDPETAAAVQATVAYWPKQKGGK